MSDQPLTTYGQLADVLESLPMLVRETRRQRRQMQRDVARLSGLSNSTISRLEAGKGDVSLDGAITLLRWLDDPTSALQGDQEDDRG